MLSGHLVHIQGQRKNPRQIAYELNLMAAEHGGVRHMRISVIRLRRISVASSFIPGS